MCARVTCAAVYAVVRTGGKQYRVEEGETLEVERLGPSGTEVELQALMIVDGDKVRSTPSELAGAKVTAKVVDEHRGPKITGFTYKNKSNQRRRWGHRQELATIEITSIKAGRSRRQPAKAAKQDEREAGGGETADDGAAD